MERLIEQALQSANIPFVTETDPRNSARLDFYLPQADVFIEVKRFHSDRIAEQMSRADNVIALQGERAVRLFAELISRDVNHG